MRWTSQLKARIGRMVTRFTSVWYRDSWELNVPKHAGQIVTEDTAYSVGAYWCCVRVICETISQMPWRVYERTAAGKRIADTHPADRLLNEAPNGVQDAPAWRELMLRWCLSWGNAYSEIVRDGSGRPMSLWPIEPWRVRPYVDRGQIIYEVAQPDGTMVYVPGADMLHFRGIGTDVIGWSVISTMARTLGLSAAQEMSFAAQMEHGTRLSGVLTPKDGGSLPKEKMERLQEQWNQQNAGASKHGKVVLMGSSLEFNPFTMPNSDAQLLESRQFSVIDICRFMRVPPHKVYDLSRATWNNITHQSLEFLQDTLGPWIVKFEHQAKRKLISSASTRYYTAIDSTAILRMDPATRTTYYKRLSDLGALSPNDIRDREGENSLGPRGDLYTVPVNLQTLERARQAAQPATPSNNGNNGDSGGEPTGANGNGQYRRIRSD